MSSDATYARLVRLWVSLWAMVFDNKRHLETVTALLQKLVWELTGKRPTHHNWPEICRVGMHNHLMMMTVATLNLGAYDSTTEQIIAAFPE